MVLDHQSDKIVFTSEPLGTLSTIEVKCALKPTSIVQNNVLLKFKYDETRNIASVQIEKNTPVSVEVLIPQ